MQCLQCHAIQGAGGNVGPDLATLPPDTTLAHVVESLLLPSKVVNPKFAAVTVQTVDGLVLSGVKVEEGETTLLLRDPVRGDTRLSKGQIEAIEPMGSLMPVGVVSRLKKNDFADLARFARPAPR
jgi:putative heme-binding domain-containing protein